MAIYRIFTSFIKTKTRLMDELFDRLRKSKFRSKFHLRDKERDYLDRKGFCEIRKEAVKFIDDRIAPAIIINDGRQTPYKNHPVFIAQHATATCCRKCIAKWYKFPPKIELNEEQKRYLVDVIMHWLKLDVHNS